MATSNALQMKRLLARPVKGTPAGKRSRKMLLMVFFALIAAVVLALIGWIYTDTARMYSLHVKPDSDVTDYGHLVNVVLANEVFPTDSLFSQLKSYVAPNARSRASWQRDEAAVNSSCPVKYSRIK